FSPDRFLLVWIVATFAFFSVSSSKMAPYILPIFPALALLGGRHIAGLSRPAWLLHIAPLAVLAVTALVMAPRVLDLAGESYSPEMLHRLLDWLSGAAAVSLASILLAMLLAWKRRNGAVVAVLAVGGLLSTSAGLLGHDQLSDFTSTRALAAQALPRIKPGLPFYSVEYYEQTLPFYLKRTLTMVQTRNELSFGIEQEPEKWIPTIDEFTLRWHEHGEAYAVMTIDIFDWLSAAGLPMSEIARNRRYVIVEKPPQLTAAPSVGRTATEPSDRPVAPGEASPTPRDATPTPVRNGAPN
ncbi:MAG: hypothetical protein KDI64_02035, partial [Candidatus Accumulibacter sp.]|nr:hypothetical protein [Accumulibacter sp.]